jgi:predicted alpha/beta superfamily hydrolase
MTDARLAARIAAHAAARFATLLLVAGSLCAAAAPTSAPAPSIAASAAPAPAPSASPPTVQVLPPFEIAALHRSRTVRIYLPPSYAGTPERRYPVIYAHDGQNLFDASAPGGGWGIGEAMDALARQRGFEAIVVGIDHGGEHRIAELSPWPNARQVPPEGEAYLAFVVETLKPWIDAHYRTRPGREATAMIGSSLGALATQRALLRWPQVFGRAAMLSPAYWFTPAAYDDTRAHLWPAGTRTWFYVGGQEDTDTVADVERMVAIVRAGGRPARDVHVHVEPLAHHDERAWRAEFPHAVAWLFEVPDDAR